MLTKEQVDDLIIELEGLKVQQAAITERRAEIRELLEVGRNEGTVLDIRRGQDTWSSRINTDRLLRYVSKRVLDECRDRHQCKGQVTVVQKPKRPRR